MRGPLRGKRREVIGCASAAVLLLALSAIPPLSGADDAPAAWDSRAVVPPWDRQEVSYVRVGTKLHIAGGGAPQQAYDPNANTWADETLVLDRTDHVQGVAVGGRIFYIGGLDLDVGYPDGEIGAVEIYDPAAPAGQQVSAGTPMPAGRERGAGGVAAYKGRIYYVGGLHGGSAVKWVDVYDPVTDTWEPLPDMPSARDHFHAVVLDGKLHVIGGRAGDLASTTGDHDAYDLEAKTWADLAALPTPRGGYGAAVIDGEIVVIGGETTAAALATVEAYLPGSTGGTWRALPAMPTARHGIQAAACSGAIYVAAGGKSPSSDPINAHERLSFGAPQSCSNAVPSCASATLATEPGAPVTGSLNCTDGDGDALAYSLVDAPDHGEVTSYGGAEPGPDAGGGFTYEPDAGYEGEDSFTVRATDGSPSPPATISVGVGVPVSTPTVTATATAPATATAAAAPGVAPSPAVKPAAGPPSYARLAGGAGRLTVGRTGSTRVRVRCPAQADATCTGTISLVTVTRFRGTKPTTRRAGRPATLARRSFAVRAGGTAAIRLKVSPRGRRLLRRGAVAARLTIAPSGAPRERWQRVRVSRR